MIGPRAYLWEGEEILATGAYTLTDLLARIPELTTFRSGWIHSPQFVALARDFTRLRVFIDGIELDAIDPRELGIHSLERISIWSLERVLVERAAGEIRVQLRTWGVQRTSAYTRTDVYTGNEETDLYRGYFGKRYSNGAVLQAGGEQSGTRNTRWGGGGDGLSVLTRVGIGRKNWSLDAFAERRRHDRTPQLGLGVPTIPGYIGTRTLAYVRAAIGGAERGPWLELVASSQIVKESSTHIDSAAAADLDAVADTVDTTASRIQYVASAGYRLGGLSLTVVDRIRKYEDEQTNAVSARLEFDSRFIYAAVNTERDGEREMNTTDGHITVRPVRFFSVSATGSTRRSTVESAQRDTKTESLRVEAGLNLGGIWLHGGTLTVNDRSPPRLSPLERDVPGLSLGESGDDRSAVLGGLRGIGWGGLGADVYVVKWNAEDLYLPRYQARTELNFQTRWLRRFPRGDFALKVAVADEFRSSVQFAEQRAGASHILWGLIEIRILRATVTFQTRNPVGKSYFIVPGYEMPRVVSTYGMRWHFWD